MYTVRDNFVYKTKINGKSKIVELLDYVEKINIQNATTQTNTLTQIPITYQTFDLDAQQYITDESINKIVDVYVNGELATTEPIVNGEGVIQFESAETGIFKIRVENYECEVVVNG